MIPDELVDRVRESADIVQIIGEYVPLKKSGADFRGPCPFHQGTHRNFSVSARRNIYYCFVCHEGGDVFAFLKKRLGIDWPSAVRMVASKVGIEIPENTGRGAVADPREPVWELNATAAEYFTRMLWEDDLGQDARDYLQRRGVDKETAMRFGLGFAPREIGLLRSHMNALGFEEDRLLAAGLLVQREEAALPRPRFMGRLMFPILDVQGRCVGFGGRLLGPGEPKYLNSADSDVFSKGRLLYGLHWARNAIRKEDKVVLVEGYFDVVRLVASGIEHVVAPLGTALTREQGSLLHRYTKNIILLYDSDAAGLKATFRAGDVLLSEGMSVQVATLPKGEDPDTYVAQHGRAGLEEQIAAAVDVFERKEQLLERSGWFSDLTRRRRALDRLLVTIRAASDPITRDLYVTRASEASGVAKDVLLREATAERGQRVPVVDATSSERPPADALYAAPVSPPRRPRRGRVSEEAAEKLVLASALQVPARIEWLAERVGQEDFWVPEHSELFAALVAAAPDLNVQELEAALSESAAGVLQELLEKGVEITDLQTSLEDGLKRMERRRLDQRLNEILREMRVASSEEKDALMRERSELAMRARELDTTRFKYSSSNNEKRG